MAKRYRPKRFGQARDGRGGAYAGLWMLMADELNDPFCDEMGVANHLRHPHLRSLRAKIGLMVRNTEEQMIAAILSRNSQFAED